MNLLDLPDCVLLDIFECLSYEEVSKNRLVCRRFDQICQQVLNCGFNKVVRQHSIIFKRIKAMLPRRESERRNHFLARHADILTSIETRVSMLSMTYSKYMDLNLCCFIPGRVLDELFHILRLVSKTRKPLRPHEVLQELRDISSMAIEHFDEKIANLLKPQVENSSRSSRSGSSLSSITFSVPSNSSWNAGISTASYSVGMPASGSSNCNSHYTEDVRNRFDVLINKRGGVLESSQKGLPVGLAEGGTNDDKCYDQYVCPAARALMSNFKRLESEYKKGIVKIHRMQLIQTHQRRKLQQAVSAVADMNTQIVELKKRLEDLDAKNREISANIKQINPAEAAQASGSLPAASIAPSTATAAATTATAPLAAATCPAASASSSVSATESVSNWRSCKSKSGACKRSAPNESDAKGTKQPKIALPE